MQFSVYRSLFIDFWLVGGSCWLMFDRCCDRDFRFFSNNLLAGNNTHPPPTIPRTRPTRGIDENITVILSVHNDWGIDTVLLLTRKIMKNNTTNEWLHNNSGCTGSSRQQPNTYSSSSLYYIICRRIMISL